MEKLRCRLPKIWRQHCKHGDSKQPHVRLSNSPPWESEWACTFVTDASDLQTSAPEFQDWVASLHWARVRWGDHRRPNSKKPVNIYMIKHTSSSLHYFTEDAGQRREWKQPMLSFWLATKWTAYNEENCFLLLITFVSDCLLATYSDGAAAAFRQLLFDSYYSTSRNTCTMKHSSRSSSPRNSFQSLTAEPASLHGNKIRCPIHAAFR